MKTKSQKFLDIFSMICAIVLFVGLLALSVFAVKLSIEQIENTCYADSSNGIVEDNLLLDNDFDIGNSVGQGWINGSKWWLGQSNSSGSFLLGSLISSNTSGYVNVRQWLDNVDHGVDLHFRVQTTAHTGNWLVQIWLYNDKNGSPSQGYTTGWFDADYKEGTFQISSSYNYAMFVIQCRNRITLDYAKLEYGSSFTGYVEKDYENYGYEQGVQYGLDNSLSLSGYTRLAGLSELQGNFALNGYNYVYGDFTEDTESLERFDTPSYAIYDSLDDGQSGDQIGRMYSSPSLYGDILISLPVCDSTMNVVFEDTITGTLLYVSKNDTLHWKYIGSTGVISGTWVSDLVQIHYFSPNVCNVYFISSEIRITDADWGSDPFYFPINTSLFGIYSTASTQPLTSFDEGFNAGVNSVDVYSYYNNGYNFGYDAGHRDGVLENTDYSFVGLIGAVFDAPVQAFSGLLDFNLLGVNLKSFVLALLSLSVIIIVIKIALGGS